MKQGVHWLRRSFEQGNRKALVSYVELDLAPNFDEKPWRVKILQKALRDAGYVDVTESGEMDEETVASVDELKTSFGVQGKGITIQLLDRLGIIEALFPNDLAEEE